MILLSFSCKDTKDNDGTEKYLPNKLKITRGINLYGLAIDFLDIDSLICQDSIYMKSARITNPLSSQITFTAFNSENMAFVDYDRLKENVDSDYFIPSFNLNFDQKNWIDSILNRYEIDSLYGPMKYSVPFSLNDRYLTSLVIEDTHQNAITDEDIRYITKGYNFANESEEFVLHLSKSGKKKFYEFTNAYPGTIFLFYDSLLIATPVYTDPLNTDQLHFIINIAQDFDYDLLFNDQLTE